MPRKTMSVRLSDELREQLDAAADVEDTTVTALVERFVREGLATADHPGIVFACATPGDASRSGSRRWRRSSGSMLAR